MRALGADAFELPTIRIEPPLNKKEFYELVADAHIYDWIVFTSPNGADAFFTAFFEIYRDARDLGAARIAAIGPATAERVRSYRLQVDVQPEKYVAEEIIEALQRETSLENLKILLARAEGAREALAVELVRRGAIVDEAVAYRTVPETSDVSGGIRRFREEEIDMITFTSSSTVEKLSGTQLATLREDENSQHRSNHLKDDARPWTAGECRSETPRHPRSGRSHQKILVGRESYPGGPQDAPDVATMCSLRRIGNL